MADTKLDVQLNFEINKSNLNAIKNNVTNALSANNLDVQGLRVYTAEIGGAGRALEDFGAKTQLAIRRYGAFTLATGGFIAAIRGFKTAVGDAINFQRELIKVSQVTGQSVKDLNSLEREITRLSTTFGVQSQELIKVSVTLAQAGLTARETQKALATLAKIDLAPTFDGIADSGEGMIAVMNQFGLRADQLEGVFGSLNTAAGRFAFESSDVIAAVKRSGGAFQAASKQGQSGVQTFQQFISLFGAVRETTRESAETIATGLKTIFTRLQRTKTQTYLQDAFDIDLRDANGQFIGAFEAIKKISSAIEGIPSTDRRFSDLVEEIGGVRQLSKAIPLIQQVAKAERIYASAQSGTNSLTADSITAQGALAVQLTKVREEFTSLIRVIASDSNFQFITKSILELTTQLISLAKAIVPIAPLLAGVAGLSFGRGISSFGKGLLSNTPQKTLGFATGGGVPGRGNSDTVPALLTPGEFVINKRSAQAYGYNALEKINRYATGGAVKLPKPTLGRFSTKDYRNGRLLEPVVIDKRRRDEVRELSKKRGPELVRARIAEYISQSLSKHLRTKKFASGGFVPGVGNSDTVPAMLTPGEFVIKKSAAQAFGYENLSKINRYMSGGKIKPGQVDPNSQFTITNPIASTGFEDVGKNVSGSQINDLIKDKFKDERKGLKGNPKEYNAIIQDFIKGYFEEVKNAINDGVNAAVKNPSNVSDIKKTIKIPITQGKPVVVAPPTEAVQEKPSKQKKTAKTAETGEKFFGFGEIPPSILNNPEYQTAKESYNVQKGVDIESQIAASQKSEEERLQAFRNPQPVQYNKSPVDNSQLKLATDVIDISNIQELSKQQKLVAQVAKSLESSGKSVDTDELVLRSSRILKQFLKTKDLSVLAPSEKDLASGNAKSVFLNQKAATEFAPADFINKRFDTSKLQGKPLDIQYLSKDIPLLGRIAPEFEDGKAAAYDKVRKLSVIKGRELVDSRNLPLDNNRRLLTMTPQQRFSLERKMQGNLPDTPSQIAENNIPLVPPKPPLGNSGNSNSFGDDCCDKLLALLRQGISVNVSNFPTSSPVGNARRSDAAIIARDKARAASQNSPPPIPKFIPNVARPTSFNGASIAPPGGAYPFGGNFKFPSQQYNTPLGPPKPDPTLATQSSSKLGFAIASLSAIPLVLDSIASFNTPVEDILSGSEKARYGLFELGKSVGQFGLVLSLLTQGDIVGTFKNFGSVIDGTVDKVGDFVRSAKTTSLPKNFFSLSAPNLSGGFNASGGLRGGLKRFGRGAGAGLLLAGAGGIVSSGIQQQADVALSAGDVDSYQSLARTSNTVSGAANGASIGIAFGSIFGPLGAAVGGLAGGIFGAIDPLNLFSNSLEIANNSLKSQINDSAELNIKLLRQGVIDTGLIEKTTKGLTSKDKGVVKESETAIQRNEEDLKKAIIDQLNNGKSLDSIISADVRAKIAKGLGVSLEAYDKELINAQKLLKNINLEYTNQAKILQQINSIAGRINNNQDNSSAFTNSVQNSQGNFALNSNSGFFANLSAGNSINADTTNSVRQSLNQVGAGNILDSSIEASKAIDLVRKGLPGLATSIKSVGDEDVQGSIEEFVGGLKLTSETALIIENALKSFGGNVREATDAFTGPDGIEKVVSSLAPVIQNTQVLFAQLNQNAEALYNTFSEVNRASNASISERQKLLDVQFNNQNTLRGLAGPFLEGRFAQPNPTENKQRQLGVLGFAGVSVDSLVQLINTNRATLAQPPQLDAESVAKRAGLIDSTERAVKALDLLSDVTNELSSSQEKLDKVRNSNDAFRGFATDYLFGDSQSRRGTLGNIRNARRLANNDFNIDSIAPSQRGGILQLFNQFRDQKVFGGLTGDEAITKVAQRGGLPKEFIDAFTRSNEEKLLEEIRDILANQEKALGGRVGIATAAEDAARSGANTVKNSAVSAENTVNTNRQFNEQAQKFGQTILDNFIQSQANIGEFFGFGGQTQSSVRAQSSVNAVGKKPTTQTQQESARASGTDVVIVNSNVMPAEKPKPRPRIDFSGDPDEQIKQSLLRSKENLAKKRQGFSFGGPVPGVGNKDSVPAMLMPGEFVLNKDAVQKIGLSRLFSMNKMADGGPVGPRKPRNIVRIIEPEHINYGRIKAPNGNGPAIGSPEYLARERDATIAKAKQRQVNERQLITSQQNQSDIKGGLPTDGRRVDYTPKLIDTQAKLLNQSKVGADKIVNAIKNNTGVSSNRQGSVIRLGKYTPTAEVKQKSITPKFLPEDASPPKKKQSVKSGFGVRGNPNAKKSTFDFVYDENGNIRGTTSGNKSTLVGAKGATNLGNTSVRDKDPLTGRYRSSTADRQEAGFNLNVKAPSSLKYESGLLSSTALTPEQTNAKQRELTLQRVKERQENEQRLNTAQQNQANTKIAQPSDGRKFNRNEAYGNTQAYGTGKLLNSYIEQTKPPLNTPVRSEQQGGTDAANIKPLTSILNDVFNNIASVMKPFVGGVEVAHNMNGTIQVDVTGGTALGNAVAETVQAEVQKLFEKWSTGLTNNDFTGKIERT